MKKITAITLTKQLTLSILFYLTLFPQALAVELPYDQSKNLINTIEQISSRHIKQSLSSPSCPTCTSKLVSHDALGLLSERIKELDPSDPNSQYTKVLLDIDQLRTEEEQWLKKAPHVHPIYSISSNDHASVLEEVCSHGESFNVVSQGELEKVTESCAQCCSKDSNNKNCCGFEKQISSRIESHGLMNLDEMKYALEKGVTQFTFASSQELKHLLKAVPKDSHVGFIFKGRPNDLKAICKNKELQTRIKGIELQIPSGQGIQSTLALVDEARHSSVGCDHFSTLDLGNVDAATAAAVERRLIGTHYQVTAKPDWASSIVAVGMRTNAVNGNSVFHLSDGVYGTLHQLMTEGGHPYSTPLTFTLYDSQGHLKENLEAKLVETPSEKGMTFFGPTCDSLDKIAVNKQFKNTPNRGDYIVVHGVGNLDTRTPFNSVKPGEVLVINRNKMTPMPFAPSHSSLSPKFIQSASTGDLIHQGDTTKNPNIKIYHMQALERQIANWKENAREIAPFYAVKSNNYPEILIRMCSKEGMGFDAATEGEIQEVIHACKECCERSPSAPCCHFNTSEQIIMAHPRKTPQGMSYASQVGVKKFTFDSPEELSELRTHGPKDAECILRIKKAKRAGAAIDFGSKFGLELSPEKLKPILNQCHQGAPITGVSFHIGTNTIPAGTKPDQKREMVQEIKSSFGSYIESAYDALDQLSKSGCKNLKTLDLGGGWLGGDNEAQNEVLHAVNSKLAEMKNKYPHLHHISVMAEPGRYMNTQVMSLGIKVNEAEFSKDGNHTIQKVHVSDGFLGSLHDLYLKLDVDFKFKIYNKNGVEKTASKNDSFRTQLIGASENSSDEGVLELSKGKSILLPRMEAGDYIVVDHAGAYTTVTESHAGLIPPSRVFVVESDAEHSSSGANDTVLEPSTTAPRSEMQHE